MMSVAMLTRIAAAMNGGKVSILTWMAKNEPPQKSAVSAKKSMCEKVTFIGWRIYHKAANNIEPIKRAPVATFVFTTPPKNPSASAQLSWRGSFT